MVLNTKSSSDVPTAGYARRILRENPHMKVDDLVHLIVGDNVTKFTKAKGRHLRLKAFRRDGRISIFSSTKYEPPVFCGVRMVRFAGGSFFTKVVSSHKMAVFNRPLFS